MLAKPIHCLLGYSRNSRFLFTWQVTEPVASKTPLLRRGNGIPTAISIFESGRIRYLLQPPVPQPLPFPTWRQRRLPCCLRILIPASNRKVTQPVHPRRRQCPTICSTIGILEPVSPISSTAAAGLDCTGHLTWKQRGRFNGLTRWTFEGGWTPTNVSISPAEANSGGGFRLHHSNGIPTADRSSPNTTCAQEITGNYPAEPGSTC